MITSPKWPESFEKKIRAMFNEVIGRPGELTIVDVQYPEDGLYPIDPSQGDPFQGYNAYKCKVILEVVRTGTQGFIFLPSEDPWTIDYIELYGACKKLVEILMRNEPELKKHWHITQ